MIGAVWAPCENAPKLCCWCYSSHAQVQREQRVAGSRSSRGRKSKANSQPPATDKQPTKNGNIENMSVYPFLISTIHTNCRCAAYR